MPRSRRPVVEDPNAPLTDEQRARLYERALNAAVWHLGQSAKAASEIREKLTRRGYPAQVIDDAIERLCQLGYLNDEAFAEQYVRSRATYRHEGAGAIRAGLRRKGLTPEVISEALSGLDDETEREAATALVQSRLRATASLDTRKRTQRLAALLVRRGYNPGLAYSVVRAVLADDASDDDFDAVDDL